MPGRCYNPSHPACPPASTPASPTFLHSTHECHNPPQPGLPSSGTTAASTPVRHLLFCSPSTIQLSPASFARLLPLAQLQHPPEPPYMVLQLKVAWGLPISPHIKPKKLMLLSYSGSLKGTLRLHRQGRKQFAKKGEPEFRLLVMSRKMYWAPGPEQQRGSAR